MDSHLRAEAAARPRAEGGATRGACTPRAGVGSGYRYYSPGLGRWVSRDPIGEFGGPHLYRALNNSCVDALDLLGRSIIDPEDRKVFLQLPSVPENTIDLPGFPVPPEVRDGLPVLPELPGGPRPPAGLPPLEGGYYVELVDRLERIACVPQRDRDWNARHCPHPSPHQNPRVFFSVNDTWPLRWVMVGPRCAIGRPDGSVFIGKWHERRIMICTAPGRVGRLFKSLGSWRPHRTERACR